MQLPARFSIYHKSLLQVIISTILLGSCVQSNGVDIEAATVKQNNIVAGYGEKTFSERYNLNIALPMPEAKFLALLDRLKLHYEVYGERGTDSGLPSPRQSTKFDLSKAEKCYEIYGGVDHGEGYRAFVDKDHQVIYIENAFSYTGP